MKCLHMMGFALAAAFCAGQANAEELTGTLKKIKETGTINIGYRDSSIPFSYLDDSQKPIGFAIDICRPMPKSSPGRSRKSRKPAPSTSATATPRFPFPIWTTARSRSALRSISAGQCRRAHRDAQENQGNRHHQHRLPRLLDSLFLSGRQPEADRLCDRYLQANAEELTGTLKKIKETGTINIGYRDSSIPFSYLDDSQKPIGFAIDICRPMPKSSPGRSRKSRKPAPSTSATATPRFPFPIWTTARSRSALRSIS